MNGRGVGGRSWCADNAELAASSGSENQDLAIVTSPGISVVFTFPLLYLNFTSAPRSMTVFNFTRINCLLDLSSAPFQLIEDR